MDGVAHGEVEALLMYARNTMPGKNGTMYVTTFPCHNRAKHLIAAGIKKVTCIEPYPKSKALEFYTNEITEDPNDGTAKVWLFGSPICLHSAPCSAMLGEERNSRLESRLRGIQKSCTEVRMDRMDWQPIRNGQSKKLWKQWNTEGGAQRDG